MSKKALLMILDGWGVGDQGKDDVIFNTPTPYWDSLLATYPHSELQASGENVGLPDGQMGNSEVGHLNIGAGRQHPEESGNRFCFLIRQRKRQEHPLHGTDFQRWCTQFFRPLVQTLRYLQGAWHRKYFYPLLHGWP